MSFLITAEVKHWTCVNNSSLPLHACALKKHRPLHYLQQPSLSSHLSTEKSRTLAGMSVCCKEPTGHSQKRVKIRRERGFKSSEANLLFLACLSTRIKTSSSMQYAHVQHAGEIDTTLFAHSYPNTPSNTETVLALC